MVWGVRIFWAIIVFYVKNLWRWLKTQAMRVGPFAAVRNRVRPKPPERPH